MTSTNCTDCSITLYRKLNNSECVCIDGYYDSGDAICLKCNFGCKLCTNGTSCSSCIGTTTRSTPSCGCNSAKFYDDGVST